VNPEIRVGVLMGGADVLSGVAGRAILAS